MADHFALERKKGLLLRSKPIQRNYLHFFKSFKTQWALKGLRKLNLF